MSEHQNRAARGLITAARLHADEAVLDQVNPSNAVFAADVVELPNQRGAAEFHAIEADRPSLLKGDRQLRRLIGRFLGIDAHHPYAVGWRVRGILQFGPFMRDVPQIPVAAIDLRLSLLQRNVVFLGVVDGVFTGHDVPFTPRGDDRQVRRERLVGQLKTNLVVALAGGAVAQRVTARFQRGLDLQLGEQRTRDRRSQQILVLVDRARADHRPNVVRHEFLAKIGDAAFTGAALQSLLL